MSYPEVTRIGLSRLYRLVTPLRLNEHLDRHWKCAGCGRTASFQPSQFVAALENRVYLFRQKRLILACPYCPEKTLVRVKGFLRLELETIARLVSQENPPDEGGPS